MTAPIPSNDPDQLDLAAVSAAYERRVEAIASEQLPLAMRLLGELEPSRWRLEWHLPLWLGNAFGLNRVVATEIAVSNVLGLASLRLRDDLVDGDLDSADIALAPAMSATLFEASVDAYRARFPPSSRFWRQLDRWMAEWKAATEDNGRPPVGHELSTGLDELDGQLRHLARRGAPLKISAFAVCLLTRRTARFPRIERCLDHALAAMVLYDHVQDWEVDLEAGRWNAFVAATGNSHDAADRERRRSSVLAAMMSGDAISRSFAVMHGELERAKVASDEVGVPALSAYLAELASRLDNEAALLHAHYSELGEHAAEVIFGEYRVTQGDRHGSRAAVES